jgi:hypothetical protein
VFSITKKGKEELEALVRSFLHVRCLLPQFLIGVALCKGCSRGRSSLDTSTPTSRRSDEFIKEGRRYAPHTRAHPDLPFNWRVLMKVGETMGENMRARLQELRDQAYNAPFRIFQVTIDR